MLLQLENISKNYRLGETLVPALRGIDLGIDKGEFVGIVGTSGSGKSTLLNILGCLDSPDSGRYLFNSRDISHFSENERSDFRNQMLGFVFQSFNLIPVLTVLDNVILPLQIRSGITHQQRHDLGREALANVGLDKFSLYLPDQLSGGQRQRVAIARALVTDAQLILADEPTANLDSKTAHQIIDLLEDLNLKRKKTFVFCTHDEKLISRVERKIHIADGQIVVNPQ